MDDRSIRAGEFVRDVRTGMDRGSLQRKYRLTGNELGKALDKLVQYGFLTRADVEGCHQTIRALEGAWTCPACGRHQRVEWEVCPVCGVIVAKFVPKPKPVVLEIQRESEIRSMRDVLSAARHNLNCLARDKALWVVLLTCFIPLLTRMSPNDVQIVIFCVLSATLWAVFFKNFLLVDSGGWALPFSAMVFTGVTGVGFLLACYYLLPPVYMRMTQSADLLVSLSGFVIQVGACEELCKIAPALVYVLWQKGRGRPVHSRTVIVLAVFSAIGFSADENVDYARRAVLHATECAKHANPDVLVTGVKGAMVSYLFRSLALVFLHAVLSGIFACFLAIGAHTRRLWPVLFVFGLAASAGLHGVYDWMVARSLLGAAIVVWLTFVLFYTLAARPQIFATEEVLNSRIR